MARKSTIGKQNTGRTAVIYARYSSHNQRDCSIEQQVEACMKHAATSKLEVVDTYADRAVSGKTDKRPQFQQMMKDAEQGKFSVVLAWKSNRMGRNMLQAMVNEERLRECGVKVLYTEEDFDESAAGRFALRNMMNVNQFYSENMAEDIRRGMMDNAQNCKATGSPPYGYKIGKDKHLEVDEDAAKVVREIYEKVAAGCRIIDIARSLNARGIKTRRGYQWNKSSFNKMLQNERYRGVYLFNDVRIEGGLPRIVSDELYYKVQEAIRMKPNPRCMGRRTANGAYLLTGKLFCGQCLAPMRGESGTSKNGKLHFYYKCQSRRTKHNCNKANVQRDYIENLIAKAIYEYCLRDDIIELIADKTVEYNMKRLKEANVGTLEDELNDVNKRLGNFLKCMETMGPSNAMRAHLAELEDEQMKLNIKLNEAKANIVSCSREQLVAGMRIFRKGNIEDKKFQADLFDTFLRAVFLYDDRFRLVFNFAGEHNTEEVPIEVLDNAALDAVYEEQADCSYKESSAPPVNSYTNTIEPTIRMFAGFGYFVFDVPLYIL